MNIVIIAILILICVSLAAACLVLWEKYKSEKEKRWNEISICASVEKEKDKEIENLNAYWQVKNKVLDSIIDDLDEEIQNLQDFKSATLCPQNNHVWDDVDGVKRCRKCGMERYGQN